MADGLEGFSAAPFPLAVSSTAPTSALEELPMELEAVGVVGSDDEPDLEILTLSTPAMLR